MNENIILISLERLASHPNKLGECKSETLQLLAEDIKAKGILKPVIVRRVENNYQIIDGHRRVDAAKLVGLTEIPCIIKSVDDKAAFEMLFHSNVKTRL